MDINDHCNLSHNQRLIRFGVMCNGTIFQEWQARCLQNLLALDNVHLALLIIVKNVTLQTIFDKIKNIHLNQILFHLYRKFIVRPRAQRHVDMTSLLSKVPSIHLETIRQLFSDAHIRTIRGYNLDFVLRFSPETICGEIFDVARYGIWSFHHDDEEKYRGGPPCFWEIYKGDDVTGAALERLTDQLDYSVVLKKGFFKTVNYSYSRNIDLVYSESARWPAQVCIDILNGNTDYLKAYPSQTKAPLFHVPNNFQMLLLVIKVLRNFLIKIYNTLFLHSQWNIGIVYEPIHIFLKSGAKPKIHWFPISKKDKFLADPFGILKNNKLTILCEEFDYRSFKGKISSIELNDDICDSKTKVAIELPVHMSYPYLFEYQGEIYCIPETGQAREIGLYKAKIFPSRWEKVATLIKDMVCLDPTVFQYDGLWWLICTDGEQGQDSNLFLWYATEFLGPWKPHAANPVKTDIRSARPAGTPFMYNGHLYRPAQDCSRTYGERIVLNQVIQLTPIRFKEKQTGVIEPCADGPFPDGVHTISAVGSITLIDRKRLIFSKSSFKNILILEIRRVLRSSLNSLLH